MGIEENKYHQFITKKTINMVNSENSSIYNESILFGILSGAGIAMLLVTAQLIIKNTIFLKILKFIALFVELGYGLNAQDIDNQNNFNFKNSVQFSLISTASVAISLATINILIFWISPGLAFDALSIQADSIGLLLFSSRISILETLVFGMIITFILLRRNKTN